MSRVQRWSDVALSRRTIANVLIVGLLAGFAGCGGEPFSFIKVSGKITYDDGSLIPADRIVVRFAPVEQQWVGKNVAGAATGDLNVQDGTFRDLTTHKYADGVVPGRYRVMLIYFGGGPGVPPRYASPDTSPLEVEVNSSNRYFELTVEKPR